LKDEKGEVIKKVTWVRTSSLSPEEILAAFRNSYNPRIAVTVDMIATGTDIKPLEIVFFMRSVGSKNFFEQMKGRGVRVVSDTEMEQVNPGIKRKTRYVIVDAVGVCERVQTESRPLEKKPTVSFEKLLDAAALGMTEVAAIESLAGRLIRLERRFDAEVEAEVVQVAKGHTLSQIAKGLLDAVDPDAILAQAREGKPEYQEPTPAEIRVIREIRGSKALAPLATNPDLRNLLKKIQKAADQTIDIISRDTLIYAGPAQKSAQTSAQLATSFRDYIEQHKAEITALQILYSRPYRQRLTGKMLKELEKKLRDNHAAWTEDRLWDAFAVTAPGKVKGRSQAGRFADLVALVCFALEQQPVLAPFADSVSERFNEWLMDKAKADRKAGLQPFTPEQLAWLNLIRDHIATSLSIEPDDFDLAPFSQRGGLGKAHQLFGDRLAPLLDELNTVLAA
jgi:type I restriction enzyme R subunit